MWGCLLSHLPDGFGGRAVSWSSAPGTHTCSATICWILESDSWSLLLPGHWGWWSGGGDPRTPHSLLHKQHREGPVGSHSMIEQVGRGAMTSPGFPRAPGMELILHVSSFVCTSRLHRTVFITAGSSVCFENSISYRSEVLGRRQNND